MSKSWQGIFTIVASPFDESGNFDEDSFINQIHWIISTGSHGIVWPGEYSEVATLTQQERLHGTELLIDTVAREFP